MDRWARGDLAALLGVPLGAGPPVVRNLEHDHLEPTMPRYIILDNVTGSIRADTLDLDGPPRDESPAEAVRRFDALTLEDKRSYTEEHPSAALNNVLGYLVYVAPDDFPKVKDGEDQDVIDAMIAACEPVAFVEVRELD
jgi:hypothetical protein